MGQNRKNLPCPKIQSYGYGTKSLWGPSNVNLGANRVPLGPRTGSKLLKITMPQNWKFRLPRGHRCFAKNGSYGYGAKSRWGPPRVHLGANGVPLGTKMGQNRENLPCPKIEFSTTPRPSIFLKKIGITVTAPNGGRDSLGSILGSIGSQWVKKMGQNRWKLPCHKIRIFHYTPVIDFLQKIEIMVMAPNHGWHPLGSILGPMGSHWIKKMGQNHKKLPCPKIRIFYYPAVINFSQKMEITVMVPNQGGDPLGSILGPIGSHWVQKLGQNLKKLPCPKIRIFDYTAVIDFSQKIEVTVMAPNHGRDPLGSIFGPMGSHWEQKNGSKLWQFTMPQNRIFYHHAVIDCSKKIEVTVTATNNGGDPLISILGPMGSHWVKKMGQHC